ncbi:hypothetical protein KB553_20460 [Chryseobacterium rhizoplanae]|uniref:hypothetical protein n=1 Tax=Chryseobacterium rhizoplanae TaxID=1609531 RepID=UPI001CE2563D|nr:hypothetical protein [Chryseobacterium rhizoplanae]UCA59364.1 hypothetical protein KB553_20460 [Chryseobacterium rhizoplanae]
MNEFMGHFGKYVSNLDASINMGWFTGDVMELQVTAILRSSSAPRNGVMKALTESAENMARKYGMSEVRIQFNMVHNSFTQMIFMNFVMIMKSLIIKKKVIILKLILYVFRK